MEEPSSHTESDDVRFCRRLLNKARWALTQAYGHFLEHSPGQRLVPCM